jgi:pimeloyl-ACP methyl ester carboxylesterase
MLRRHPLAVVLCAGALLAAGCSDGNGAANVSNAPGTNSPGTSPPGRTAPSTGSTSPGSSGPTTAPPATINWEPTSDDARVETGHLKVPLDYSDPTKGTVDLFLARHLADPKHRIGSLLVNPGGPGFGGTDFAYQAAAVYSPTLVSHFDIVGWDPRGTGLTTPAIDCFSDYDHFYGGTDITPDTPAERQQNVDIAKELAADCVKKNGEFMAYMGTNNTARDIDSIRRALGETTISYFGFSYGSELGAAWLTMFPGTVRAAVLDGAVDPTLGLNDGSLQQAKGFEQALQTFLDRCSTDTGCAFHNGGDASGAFDRLMASIDDHPLPADPARPDVTRGVALNGVAQAMYSRTLWPDLEQALADAQKGDGTGLLTLNDQYYRRHADGTYDNLLEAFQVITCEDKPDRPTVAQDDADTARFRAAAPRFAPSTVGAYFCTFFPPTTDPRVTITGKGAGPVLVMGTTGDPATPLAGTKKMADTLEDGRLVVVTADQHTGYGANQCSFDAVDNYLIDPVKNAPADGTTCR